MTNNINNGCLPFRCCNCMAFVYMQAGSLTRQVLVMLLVTPLLLLLLYDSQSFNISVLSLSFAGLPKCIKNIFWGEHQCETNILPIKVLKFPENILPH